MTALVTQHLPLVAGAPDGIRRLRELILELAIRGKLVPHSGSDEPVDVLLSRISAVRSAAKLKSRIGSIAETELAPPFNAPQGWQWVRLGELLSKIGAGSTPLGGKQAYVDSGVKFLRSQNVWNEGLRLDDVARISDETHQKMSGTHVAAGDILFNITGASIGRCAIVPSSFDTGNVSQHVTIIRPCIPDICGYLHKVLISGLVQDTVMAVQVGVSREGLSIGKLGQFPIPLPPLDEQHRIVAKVDELMALCDRLEADQADAEAAHAQLVQALLDSLTQATDAADFRASWQRLSEHFHTLFTTEASIDALKQAVLQLAVMGRLATQELAENANRQPLMAMSASAAKTKRSTKAGLPIPEKVPFALPDGWRWVRFNDLIEPDFPIAYGVLVPGPEVADGIPFVRIADLDLTKPRALPEKTIAPEIDAQFARTRLRGGEILMGVVGSIGKLGVAPPSWAGANIARAICRIVPSSEVSKSFVLWLLQTQFMRSQFLGDTRTLAQPTLNVGLIREALTPLPPLAEQHRIVAKVNELMALCDQLKAQLAEARQQHAQLATVLVEQAVA